ncbi:MAG: hypothetical protein HWE25_09460 [Alphaproteobacteria bacterium]|nr:hypothetical protein [Alphaproteobacteria bacterium]
MVDAGKSYNRLLLLIMIGGSFASWVLGVLTDNFNFALAGMFVTMIALLILSKVKRCPNCNVEFGYRRLKWLPQLPIRSSFADKKCHKCGIVFAAYARENSDAEGLT